MSTTWLSRIFDAIGRERRADPVALQKRNREDQKAVFDSPAGRRVLAGLARHYKVFDSTINAGQREADPYMMIFREGQRSVVLDLIRATDEPPIEYFHYEDTADDRIIT